MVFFDVSPSFSENEKGVFSGFPGRLFSGCMKNHIPLDYFSQGILRNEWKTCWAKDGKNMKRKRLIINGLRNIIGTYCSRNMSRNVPSHLDWL